MVMKTKTPWERAMQAGGNCSDFKWRRQRLPSGSVVYRRVGQRNPMKAIRVVINPVSKDKYNVWWRNASWFDMMGDPDEQRISLKEADIFAKKHMKEGFCYD